MARGFRFGGAGGGRSESAKYVYKDGTWDTAYLNPGTYAYSGASSGWTLGSDKLSSASGVSSIIGTATTVDVANYSTLHIKAKAISGTTASVFISTQAAYPGGFIRNVSITTVGSVVDYTINVADQTAVYIGAISTDSVATEIYEIYLTERTGYPKYLIKDGVCSEDFALVSSSYNTSGYASTNKPTITYETGYVNIAIGLASTWAASACSVIGVMGFNPDASDTIHIRAAVTSFPNTSHSYASYPFKLGQMSANTNSFTIQAGQDLTNQASSDIINYSFKLASTNPWFCLPNMVETGSGTLNIKIYDIYLN